MSSNFDPWWYYEMGRVSAKHTRRPQRKSAPARTQRTSPSVALVVLWVFLTAILSVVVYIVATIFGGLDLWFCLIISGLFSFWLCSLLAC